MNGQWNWLIGRKLSLGEVVDVFGESAIKPRREAASA